jgi:hypothetical protein
MNPLQKMYILIIIIIIIKRGNIEEVSCELGKDISDNNTNLTKYIININLNVVLKNF